MSCPTWGRDSTRDEVRVLVGPVAVAGTILAAIARGIRPEGMAIGSRGRRGAIAGATFLAAATMVSMCLAIYANESCSDTVVFGRTEDSSVTLLQLFWMLEPGVATAAIISAMCTLVATKLSLPRWSSTGWKVSHIPRILRNGVVSPRDDYGIGVSALRRYSFLWWLASGLWFVVSAVMVYTTLRGDLTNGLLNLAGLLAVATNTGIPVWNISKIGSGTDSKSQNIDLIRSVETNVVGNFYDNVAAVTTTALATDTVSGAPIVVGRTQNYVVANAHAMIADYRGTEMEVGWFADYGQDPAPLGRAVIAATLATTKKLSRLLAEADYGGDDSELSTLSAYMSTIAAESAWVKVPAQRRRLLAVAMAIAWSMKITGALGGKIARTDASLNARHEALRCSCCLHRWTVWRPLEESANVEMEILFGRSGNLPQIKEERSKQEFAASVWAHLRENVGTNVRNRGLLLYYWVMAMMDNAMLKSYDSFDFFPQANIKVQAFSAQDFKVGCSTMDDNAAYSWKPSVSAPHAHPEPLQQCTVDSNELAANPAEGRHRLYPHPKVLDHMARRTIFRGAAVQSVIWGIQGLRGLFSG